MAVAELATSTSYSKTCRRQYLRLPSVAPLTTAAACAYSHESGAPKSLSLLRPMKPRLQCKPKSQRPRGIVMASSASITISRLTLICLKNAPDIPTKNFHALTRLDENKSKCQLALKARVFHDKVSNVTIWGNHSTTQVPDFLKC